MIGRGTTLSWMSPVGFNINGTTNCKSVVNFLIPINSNFFCRVFLSTEIVYVQVENNILNPISGTFVKYFGCQNCGKQYVQKRSLSRHLRYECGKPRGFKCLYCNYTSHQKVSLQGHLLRIHKDLVYESVE